MTTASYIPPESGGGTGQCAGAARASRPPDEDAGPAAALSIDDILITEQLALRHARTPDYAAETRALHAVARAMGTSPTAALDALLGQALALCLPGGNGTAGVSLLQTDATTGVEQFHWTALAGRLASHVGGTTPRDFSPCGVCLNEGHPVLLARPDLCFTYSLATGVPFIEGLVLPFTVDGAPAGTIWVISHDETRPFDAEDVRVMTSLADFAGTAYSLIRASDRAATILESISDAFYAVDDAFRFTYVNRKAEAVWERPRETLLGRSYWSEFPAAVGTETHRMHHQAMQTRQPLHYETIAPLFGRWVEVSIYPAEGGGLSCYFREVDERKAAEAERERLLDAERTAHEDAEAARRDAEAANRAKGDFLAVMSHELRTPLNAIGGYAELMDLGIRGPVTAEQHEDLVRIRNSQRHLLGLINELLNYAKLETGSVDYDLSAVALADAMAEAADLVSPQAATRRLTLQIGQCPPELAVRADGEKLRQVLVNLLSNAVKFTRPGGQVFLMCAPEGALMRVEVRDTGIGIPADKLASIFDPFVQIDSRLTRTTEGTGLGLAISRDLARGMGGDLTVQSELGVGSTFTLVLPAG